MREVWVRFPVPRLQNKFMKIRISPLTENSLTLMRRAGYTFQREEQGEKSFIRPLARAGYPRFHCYTKQAGLEFSINIHLDQKKHTYGEYTRHHGEYEDSLPLREEAARLLELFGENATIV